MGLTKQYLRYAPSALFGVVGTSKANIVTVEIDDIQSNLVAVTAVEDVLIWDLKKGEIVRKIYLSFHILSLFKYFFDTSSPIHTIAHRETKFTDKWFN